MLKPLIKYTGGKYKEYDKIKQYFPTEIKNYYEPFFGGGGVYFRLHNENLISGKSYINDFSISLTEFYESVADDNFRIELDKISDAWDAIRDRMGESIIVHDDRVVIHLDGIPVVSKGMWNGGLVGEIDSTSTVEAYCDECYIWRIKKKYPTVHVLILNVEDKKITIQFR